jgi:long-chain acyl-CoA synthetase
MRDHLATLLDDFRRYGREVAVVRYQGIRRRVTTYGEIARLAGRFAALLAQRGIEPGDRVLLWAENSAEWIAAFHGCLLRGVLAVPLDAKGTAEFAGRVSADVNPKLAVGDALLLNQLTPNLPRLAFEDWLTQLPQEEAGPIPGLSAETPLQILFTSGTTGDPKGVVITHGNVLASITPIEVGAQRYMGLRRLVHPLRILNTLPLSHVFGQTMGLWVPPIFIAELHFESRLVASRLIETIRRERISLLAAVPRVLSLLKVQLESTLPNLAERVVSARENAKGISFIKRWWRFRDVHLTFGLKFWAIISGGGALEGPLEQFWSAVGVVVVQGYGMTETTAIITLNHPFHVAQGTIGKPVPGREVKLGPDGEVLVRGASISKATWFGGALHPRESEWLATGDLAEKLPTGELRFLGRKSEVIVTAAGLNIHPEDLETAIDREPGVMASAVVGLDTANGPEPCAVLAFRGTREQAAAAVESANSSLAEFQRILRWEIWPEPDLPRTSTGKVRRKAVAEWLAEKHGAAAQAYAQSGAASANGTSPGARADWLLTLIAQITGEAPPDNADNLRLAEDLHLDSLGRAQLAAAIEERLGTGPDGNGALDQINTLGDLRRLMGAVGDNAQTDARPDRERNPIVNGAANGSVSPGVAGRDDETEAVPPSSAAQQAPASYIYPHWPWSFPVRWLRVAFLEAVLRPMVWLLAKPAVVAPGRMDASEPMLIVANHVTAYDAPLLEFALPGKIRRKIAVAMSGEMLEDFKRFRNPYPGPSYGRFMLRGPLNYLLVTALFNVFPLHKQRDFQRSFAHAGEALDRGFNVLVFPEGARSEDGEMAAFRPGIGLLVKQSSAPVLPMAMRGLGSVTSPTSRRLHWFRSGILELRVGKPIRFAATDSETAITARLQAEVEKLLNG